MKSSNTTVIRPSFTIAVLEVCLDMTPAMLSAGKSKAEKQNIHNLTFVTGDAQELPRLFTSHSVHMEKCESTNMPVSLNSWLEFTETSAPVRQDIVDHLLFIKRSHRSMPRWLLFFLKELGFIVSLPRSLHPGRASTHVLCRRYVSSPTDCHRSAGCPMRSTWRNPGRQPSDGIFL